MHAAILGAGPAGAALALLLARRGVQVSLLERQTDFEREFRGEGLMPSGVDALAQMGLAAQLEALPQSRVERLEVYQGARRVFALAAADLGSALPRFVSQPALLEMLAAEGGRLPSYRLDRGFTVRDLLRDDAGRVVGVRGDAREGPREVRADFVIGTDGRASVARKRSGLDALESPESFDVVWCKVPLPEGPAGRDGRAYLGRGHFCLTFPSPDGRLQLAWVIDKGTFGELRSRGVEEWAAELAANVSPDLADHVRGRSDSLSDPFLLDVLCDHLERWSEPGLLLLGDACHPMSPVGAQGINIALRDALVASNHLGPLLAAGASPEELDAAARAVRDERLPEVKAVQATQRRAPRMVFQRTRVSRLLLRWLAPLFLRTPLPRLFVRRNFDLFAHGATRVVLENAARA